MTRRNNIQNKAQLCVVFHHNDFEGIELYCHKHYATVLEEGAASDLFSDLLIANNGKDRNDSVQENEESEEEVPIEIPVLTTNINDDIEQMLLEGFGVDDDNEPAPENIPTLNPEADNDRPTVDFKADFKKVLL